MQKKVLPLLPDIQSYDIIYLIKNMLSTKSHTEAYGKAKSSLICCIYQVFTPPPPINTYLHFRSNDIYRRQYPPCGFRRVFGWVERTNGKKIIENKYINLRQ